jgi:5-(carboxyamino)imidazole ribonucleotide mutase
MPAGVPVATFAVGKAGAVNAAVFAARMLSLTHSEVLLQLEMFRANNCRLPD